ncbi:hypothetical protein VB796_18480 [Arcicella sp. LKC2W]|uniref:hypothetical protein n=1 Tax=Arcicella sp. LKC2W TaxID=2984198 RepID=UPI002B1ECC93|nr:hypothetical protein [Arcicella sp. LKC2W]MEA5461055.1 hypothetical protein [Arcicella sp. LKC2W]
MKRIYTILTMITLFSGSCFAQSQNYKAFKVEFLPGYALPISSVGGIKGGFCLSLEPKYNINDNIAVGIKIEGAAVAIVTNTNSNDGIVSLISSYSLTGEYYLGESGVRPFAGIGIGSYKTSIFDTKELKELALSESTIGFAPRLGLQINHFRIVGEYNLVKDSNYLTFKLGFTIGGGKK